jgi:hypothetical protein
MLTSSIVEALLAADHTARASSPAISRRLAEYAAYQYLICTTSSRFTTQSMRKCHLPGHGTEKGISHSDGLGHRSCAERLGNRLELAPQSVSTPYTYCTTILVINFDIFVCGWLTSSSLGGLGNGLEPIRYNIRDERDDLDF